MKLPMNPLLLLLALGAVRAMDHGAHEMNTHQPVATNCVAPECTPIPHEGHTHGMPILDMDLTPAERAYWESYSTETYFNVSPKDTPKLMTHLVLIIATFVFLYPLVLVFKNTKSRWHFPALTLHFVLVNISLAAYARFIRAVPDIYPRNAYTRMSWVVFFFNLALYVSAVMRLLSGYLDQGDRTQFIPLKSMEEGPGSPSTLIDTPSASHSDSSSFELDNELREPFFAIPTPNRLNTRFSNVARLTFNFFNFAVLFLFFVYLPTGVAVLNLLGQKERVFNLLAHFIKGGVFFSLGLLSLSRYCGAFSKFGYAWNHSYVLPRERSSSFWLRIQPNVSLCSMEMLESSLICFYGCTNVFLEHLAGNGGAWTAKDLQHVSIAFMYVGCGLCGIICDLKLYQWRRAKFDKSLRDCNITLSEEGASVTPGFSPNPFPAFTIFWTGILMSQHAQASELSTSVHVQWGSMLAYGSIVRLLTYVMLTYFPGFKSTLFSPSRPLTELLTSFALLCGGLVFMESTDQSIEAMEWRGFTAMFTLNVSVGCIVLLMGWIMVVFAVKDRLSQHS